MFMSDWTGKGSKNTPTVKNLAKIFNPHEPICGPGYNPARMVVATDVPEGLQKAAATAAAIFITINITFEYFADPDNCAACCCCCCCCCHYFYCYHEFNNILLLVCYYYYYYYYYYYC